MFSILQISDLHRSSEEPVDNNSLLAALLTDRDRYVGETPVIPPFGAIIVSGDLIQGAALGRANWKAILRDQYRVAGEFLDRLTCRFLAGDRSKIIIIPGNHDVCWNTSLSAMVRVPDAEYPNDVRSALITPSSNYRWSWKERALYKITNPDLYNERMGPYWEFVESFYAGVPLFKPIDRNRGYQLFELHDRRIVVAAFDSTSGNDCFSYSGEISRGTIGKCNLDLRDIPHSYGLRIAVWHHSIQGPPLRDDYMDIGQMHEMIGLGFQLGIHGHQHVAATATYYIHLSESQSMAVISAGSLCAGSKQLPRGINRQYNVIVVEDDLLHARVHVREMTEGEQFSRKSNGAFLKGFVHLSWEAEADAMGRLINTHKENARRAILQAEEALYSGKAQRAIDLLMGSELLPGSHARRIAIEAAIKLQNWELLVEIISEPCSTEEAVLLISALIQTDSLDRAVAILTDNPAIDPPMRKELEGQIETKRLMRNQ